MADQVLFSQLALARMKELVDGRTSWHRALWQIGTVTSLREVAEAAEATWSGSIPSPEALKDLQTSCVRQVLRDHGVGSDDERSNFARIVESLPSKPTASGAYAQLSSVLQLAERARKGYLDRWSDHVSRGNLQEAEVEVVARLTIAHLLDEGLHKAHIHGWLTNLDEEESLDQVLEHAQRMLLEEEREFELLCPIRSLDPKVKSHLADALVSPEEYIAKYLELCKPNAVAPNRPAAAMKLTFSARDPHSAVSAAFKRMQRIEDRASVGLGKSGISFGATIIDLTTKKIRELRNEARPVTLPSVQRNGQYLTDPDLSSHQARIEDTLGMLAANQYRASPTGIASIWAALEALLGLPGGKGVDAADKLADIVTCSFPRAELTELARRWERVGEGPLADAIRDESFNGGKAALFFQAVCDSQEPEFDAPKDAAAVQRLRQLLADPTEVLERVRSYYVTCFRRLYYQRNFIMHGAKIDSVSLPATSRTAPQLVAAGIDRLVNASFSSNMDPHALAARARIELEMAKTGAHKPLHSLLG